MPAVLVDAGPLVALFDRSDLHHHRCVETLMSLQEPLVTVWPVISEAMHLLRFSLEAQDAVWELVLADTVSILPLDGDDVPRIKELMRQYRNLPMDFADAALVRVAEREKSRTIFTLDRRDFQVYRPSRIGRFTIIPSR